jgi:dTDP-glucose 4,6-dehydratase
MDVRKINRSLGWQPRQTLSSGLLKTVEWYIENTVWIEAIREQQDYQGWLDKNYNIRGGSA